MADPTRLIHRPDDLDLGVLEEVARRRCRLELAPGLLGGLAENREGVLRALGGGQLVYGVNTGMGAFAGVRLDAEAQAHHQDTLMAGRAVGSAPWLRREQARAVVAARLRTFLDPAAGVSPQLCELLARLLDLDVVPAVPARGSGAAGEIIPLAHVGAVLLGTGQVLDDSGRAVDAGPALRAAGLAPRGFAAKEGVAFLEGVPGLTGLAALAVADVGRLLPQIVLRLGGRAGAGRGQPRSAASGARPGRRRAGRGAGGDARGAAATARCAGCRRRCRSGSPPRPWRSRCGRCRPWRRRPGGRRRP